MDEETPQVVVETLDVAEVPQPIMGEIVTTQSTSSENLPVTTVEPSDGAIVPTDEDIANQETILARKVHKEELETDTKEVRQNLKDIIKNGQIAIESMLEVANSDNDARSFRALSELIGSVVTANRTLIDVHEKVTGIRTKSEAPLNLSGSASSGNDTSGLSLGQNVQNQYIFTGSTKDLQELLDKNTKKKRYRRTKAEMIQAKSQLLSTETVDEEEQYGT
jgi:hypothetical protein